MIPTYTIWAYAWRKTSTHTNCAHTKLDLWAKWDLTLDEMCTFTLIRNNGRPRGCFCLHQAHFSYASLQWKWAFTKTCAPTHPHTHRTFIHTTKQPLMQTQESTCFHMLHYAMPVWMILNRDDVLLFLMAARHAFTTWVLKRPTATQEKSSHKNPVSVSLISDAGECGNHCGICSSSSDVVRGDS